MIDLNYVIAACFGLSLFCQLYCGHNSESNSDIVAYIWGAGFASTVLTAVLWVVSV